LNGLIPQLTLVNVRVNLHIHFIDCCHFVMSQIILLPVLWVGLVSKTAQTE
jgi:hypothetical protein